ncbi:MAG TPA: SpoIID/LytB domain-containing protein [Vicinamibacterales bacterium]|nr:SpoIID/LytB domain-containing protein [Vicinamibacterales bacterium]
MSARSIRILPAAIVAGLATLGAACAAGPGTAPVFLRPASRVVLPERVLVRTGGRIVSVDLESYVVDTILSEVSPLNEPEPVVAGIFEVQAVVARTYAVSRLGRHRDEGFDLCDSTHCQIYQPSRRQSSRFAATAAQAVQRTRGLVLTYDAHPIEALFHADCGGATASADAVWGGTPVPYLHTSVDDLPEPTHRPWRVTAKAEQIRKALNLDQRTSVGAKLESITVASRDSSGRAATLAIRGARTVNVRGDVLRAVLNRTLGDRAVQSTLFTVQRQGADYVFAGAGFGHGVGLCQRGAAARLRRGDSVEEVLRAYYTGTKALRGQ